MSKNKKKKKNKIPPIPPLPPPDRIYKNEKLINQEEIDAWKN